MLRNQHLLTPPRAPEFPVFVGKPKHRFAIGHTDDVQPHRHAQVVIYPTEHLVRLVNFDGSAFQTEILAQRGDDAAMNAGHCGGAEIERDTVGHLVSERREHALARVHEISIRTGLRRASREVCGAGVCKVSEFLRAVRVRNRRCRVLRNVVWRRACRVGGTAPRLRGMEPMQSLILLVAGPDRPGLVRQLAERVQAAGGNWLESRFAHLAGHFAGVVRVEVPTARRAELESAARGLESEGLTILVMPTTPRPGGVTGESWCLELVGHDRPGIVHQVSAVLQRHGVNIEELETGTEQAAQTNDRLFRARARVTVPAGTKVADVRRELESIASELMVDLTLHREGGDDAG